MNELGKLLVVIGLLFVAGGLVICTRIGKSWLGHLPGDMHYTRGNFNFYFPIVTCLLVSLLLTLIMWLFRR